MIQNPAANEAISVTPAMLATSALTQGRLVGFGMLVSFALGMYSNFQLQSDLFSNGGFMVQAAQQPSLVGIIVVLGLITGLISLAIAADFPPTHGRADAGVKSLLSAAGDGWICHEPGGAHCAAGHAPGQRGLPDSRTGSCCKL